MTDKSDLTISRLALRAWGEFSTAVAISWQEFVALFAVPHRAGCTLESCRGSGCPYKEGACWSPAVFRGDHRTRHDVETISCLVLDVDHAPEARGAALLDKLAAYQYVLHSTHADRRDDRCLRVIIRLSRPVTIGEWPWFWQEATRSLGSLMDPACADAARCYYLPSRPRDADYFVVEHAGEPLDVAAILASRRSTWELLIDHVKGLSTFPARLVDLVVADMRSRSGGGQVSVLEGGGPLATAYQRTLDVSVSLSTELDENGVALDHPPSSWQLVRVQALLWEHVRMVVQLRALIEERGP